MTEYHQTDDWDLEDHLKGEYGSGWREMYDAQLKAEEQAQWEQWAIKNNICRICRQNSAKRCYCTDNRRIRNRKRINRRRSTYKKRQEGLSACKGKLCSFGPRSPGVRIVRP